MAQPRLAFWVLLAAAVWVLASSLGAGILAAAAGLAVAAALLAGAASASRAGQPKAARRVIGAGAAALLFGLAQLLLGGGAGALVSLGFALASLYAGAQLALERAPVAEELPPRSPRGPGLAFAVAADEGLLLSWDWNGRIGLPGTPAWLVARLRRAAERNAERGWLADPEGAHPLPPALEKPSLARIAVRGFGSAERLRFESDYEPGDPEVRDGFLSVRTNRSAEAWLWRHPGGPRPTLVCVHGYTGGRVRFDARMFEVSRLYREVGVDVALFVLPLHGARALGRRSGQGFLGGDPLWTSAAVGQAIWDLRRLTGWLRSEGAPLVGVMGGSLGGYVAALYASLDGRLACAVPHVPVVRLAKLVWTELPEARRRALEAAGASEALLDEAWASHAPLRHRPRVAPEGRLIVAGAADRVCTPDHARALQAHWEGSEIHWFLGSHLVPLGRGGVRLRVAALLRQRLLAAAAEEPAPGSESREGEAGAPTVEPEPNGRADGGPDFARDASTTLSRFRHGSG
jgi:dienelactone hydrolase